MATTRGPLHPAVYWRRRLFVLGTLVALVLTLVNMVRGGDDAPRADAEATTVSGEVAPAKTPSVSPKKTGPGNKSGQGKKKAKQRPIEPPEPVLATPTGPCDDADVAVSPFVAGAVAGRPVTITLQLRTIESAACTWRVTANRLALKISRAGEQVWASWQCPTQLGVQDVVVRSAVTATVNVPWNSRYSEGGCPRETPYAGVGTYEVTVAAFGGEPSSVEFTLAQPTVGSRTAVPGTSGKG
ncbi:MAG: hypothetical protein WB767_03805 [Nocardioides sp.]